MNRPDPERVRQSFQRARAVYDEEARAQAATAARLLALLAEARPDFAPRLALEVGCGTGILSRGVLARYGATLTACVVNDLVAEYEEDLRRLPNPHGVGLRFLAGDIEEIDLPPGIDLVVSSSTLHWVRDLARLTARLAGCLRPGGMLALSLYGPDNLRELRALTGSGLDYPSLEELRRLAAPWGRVLVSCEEPCRLWFDHPLDVLRHLRDTGANAITRRGWTRGELTRFIQGYQSRFGSGGRVSLSYHPLFIVLETGMTGGRQP